MNLVQWLYRRDREEYILSLPGGIIHYAKHLSKQEEAEQEIERTLRA